MSLLCPERVGGPLHADGEDVDRQASCLVIGVAPNRIGILKRIPGLAFRTCWRNRRSFDIAGTRANFRNLDDLLYNQPLSADLPGCRVASPNALAASGLYGSIRILRIRVGSARMTVRRWPSIVTLSPVLASRPSRSRTRPPTVSASVSGTSIPQVSARTSSGHGGVDLVDVFAQRCDRRGLAIEFVLDRPDQLFEHVFEGDHADDAAVFVEQHGQVHPVPLELEQELVEPERHGQERDLAASWRSSGRPF